MRRIAIVTATRAEYGLLYPVIKELRKFESDELSIQLIVTGTHLVKEFGMTVDDIVNDGIRIDKKIYIPVVSTNKIDIANNQAETLKLFSEEFRDGEYNAVVILGDRYEMLMVAIAAVDMNIPIIHLYGGDTTEGAIDECFRHSISKMSFLHFVSNEESRKRVIQLGEDPARVFNFGAPGTDNVLRIEKLSKEDALKSVGLCSNCMYAICTYHPVTLSDEDVEIQILNFLEALSSFDNMQFIITKSNADQGGELINYILERESTKRENIHVFASLGLKRYLSLMEHAEVVIGNSSSGIMEAPIFHVPTVNIGERQRGRLQASSIINCDSDKNSIINAIKKALSPDFRENCSNVSNPYGDGHSSERIAAKIVECINGTIDLKKSFFRIESND